MDDDRIDFSPLDPAASPARMERMVGAVLTALSVAPVPDYPLQRQLIRWGRFVAATSAALALGVWVPTLVKGEAAAPSEPVRDPIEVVVGWAQLDAVPADADMEEVLGVLDGQ